MSENLNFGRFTGRCFIPSAAMPPCNECGDISTYIGNDAALCQAHLEARFGVRECLEYLKR